MLKKTLATTLALIISACYVFSSAMAQQRHEDYPLTTQWQVFRYATDEGQSGLAAVLWIEPDAGWYTYTQSPGGLAKPTRITASLKGSGPLKTVYPPGKAKDDVVNPGTTVNAYEGRTPILFPLPEGAKPPLALTAQVEMLLCTKDKCLPTRLELTHTEKAQATWPDARKQAWWPVLAKALKAAPKAPAAQAPASEALPAPSVSAAEPAATATAPGDWSGLKPRYLQPSLEVGGLLKAVLLGLLAGFILNFMPCALPVISLKLSALMAGSGGACEATRRSKIREHFLFLALGAMLYFLFLAALFGLTDLAWGQLFQEPEVVLALTLLVFGLSLSLLGVFSLPIIDLKFDQMTTHPKLQSLFTGMLTTLLATPCSGPFLGGVLGWALLQPPAVITTVLMSIGLGMATPYLGIVAFPGLVRHFPKPGPWTAHVERAVALFLMGTCIYLLNILPEAMVLPALVLLLLTAVCAWIWGDAGPGFDTTRARVMKLTAVGLMAVGLFWALQPSPKAPWERFSRPALTEALGQDTVLVDFTADWCPTCKVLEQTNLTPARLTMLKARYGVRLMKADLTERNPEAEALLHSLGSKSIPLLAIFPKSMPESPLVLRDLFTPEQLEDAVRQSTEK